MGYACPVCETPQADAGHLANHLGFTAVARGGAHEAWLDEHVPDWGSLDEVALAERVVEHAAETEFPQVFEDTTGQGRGIGDGAAGRERAGEPSDGEEHPAEFPAAGHVPDTPESLVDAVDFSALREDDDIDDGELDEIIEQARELTRLRRDDSETE